MDFGSWFVTSTGFVLRLFASTWPVGRVVTIKHGSGDVSGSAVRKASLPLANPWVASIAASTSMHLVERRFPDRTTIGRDA